MRKSQWEKANLSGILQIFSDMLKEKALFL